MFIFGCKKSFRFVAPMLYVTKVLKYKKYYTIRMQSDGYAGFTFSITPSFSSFLRCVASLSW